MAPNAWSRERLLAEYKKKDAENGKLRKVLREVETVLKLSDPEGDRAKHIIAPEDAAVLGLCQRHGFGAVMDSAARQWRNNAPLGHIGAYTTGACVGTVQRTLVMVRDAIAGRFDE